jgi:hypothetical protein
MMWQNVEVECEQEQELEVRLKVWRRGKAWRFFD